MHSKRKLSAEDVLFCLSNITGCLFEKAHNYLKEVFTTGPLSLENIDDIANV